MEIDTENGSFACCLLAVSVYCFTLVAINASESELVLFAVSIESRLVDYLIQLKAFEYRAILESYSNNLRSLG